MDVIERAVKHRYWDRLDSPTPSVIVLMNIDPDTHEIHLLIRAFYSDSVSDPVEFLSIFRSSFCNRGAFLFEVSVEQYCKNNGRYDVIVGIIGSIGSSKISVKIREDGEFFFLNVCAGELVPIWRRVTVLPSINHRFRTYSGVAPATLELISGHPPRILCASLCYDDRRMVAFAHTLHFPDGQPPVGSLEFTRKRESWDMDLALPDIVSAPESMVRERCAKITKELMEAVWHPERVARMVAANVDALDVQ